MVARCATCGEANREGRKFCAGCGARLQVACPECGTGNEVGERFCGECGGAVVYPSSQALPAAIEQPEVDSLASGTRRELHGERKQVTVLFADVKGSMDLAEGLDPEEWARIMDRFFSLLSDGVRRFGGTVDKFTGDGIMALFGAPMAQEDHARRACHAALHLSTSASGYADELRRSHALNLHVRIGLNSGEVVIGRVGGEASSEYTAVGHTVGLAQRMEALSEPGTAYLTEYTARLVSGHLRLRDLGLFPVKGSSEPLRVYVLEGPSRRRRGVARWPGRSPLVGRAEEMAALEGALAKAQAGHAQVVGVVGEAGVGKSRLCEEFTLGVAALGIPVRRAAGVSHAQGVPLLPVLELLRDNFGVTDADDARVAREKVAGRLLLLDPGFEEDLPLLFDFLEVPDPQRPPPQLAPDVRRRRVFGALRRLTQHRSEQEALVLLVEDLHWFDPQSDAFLTELIALYPGTRTLVVANFRPEYQAPWMRHSYYQQLSLAPLSPAAAEELLAALLGDDPLLPPLPAQVIERTGGNPFYVEEVVRSLAEDGTLEGEPGAYRLTRPVADLRLPPTVQATLAARIDRLAGRDKHVLQTASVIGRTFPEAVLTAVAGRPEEDLAAALHALCEAEFLQQEAAWPVAEYRFWHVLTQEAAYSTLLLERRQRLHAAVANALADLDPARADERAALIASHYERAGYRLEAARWEYRAAAGERQRDVADAVRHLHAALDLLDGVPESEECLRLGAMTRVQLLRTAPRLGRMDPDEARALYRDATELTERLGDEVLSSLVLFGRGASHLSRGEVAEAAATYLEANQLASTTGDAGLRAATSMIAGLGCLYAGPLTLALTHFEAAVIAAAGNPDAGVRHAGWSPLVNSHHFGGMALGLAGRISKGRDSMELALRLARGRPETETTAWTLSSLVHLLGLSGEQYEDAFSLATDAEGMSRESGNVLSHVVALHALGVAEHVAGHLDRAETVITLALGRAREHQTGLFEEPGLLARLASVRLAREDHDGARAAADEAVEVVRRQGARVVECFCLLTRARVRREAGGPGDAALADVDAGLALAAEVSAITYQAFLTEELARLHGDDRLLAEAVHRYQEIGATGHAHRLEAEPPSGP